VLLAARVAPPEVLLCSWDMVLKVRNEIAVLKKVSMGHQNILTLVDYFETMNNCVFGYSHASYSARELGLISVAMNSVPRYRSCPRWRII
jgi:hypothetical protein